MGTWRYRAFGLELSSSLALPGLQPSRNPRDPVLTIRPGNDRAQREPGAGRRVWSGPDDGVATLDLDACPAGGHRFKYGREATFHLPAGCDELRYDVHRPGGLAWQRVLIDSVLPLTWVLAGGEALRAGAVEGPDGVIAIVGAEQTTTPIVADLVQRGYRLFTDRALALELCEGEVIAHPGAPVLTVALETGLQTAPTELGVTLAAFGNQAWVAVHRHAREPAPLRAVHVVSASALGPLLSHRTRAERAPRHLLFSQLQATVPVGRLEAEGAAGAMAIDAAASRTARHPSRRADVA
jgi:hypothetical protein